MVRGAWEPGAQRDQPGAERGSFGRPEVAAAYATAPLFAAGEDLPLLVEVAALTGAERVLDIGTAAGHTALALAPHARTVLATDPALAMLREARRLSAERQIANLTLTAALADPLPFPNTVFDVVTCRYAAHHFPDLPGALWEVARVLRPGGRFVVVDVIAPENPALDSFINEVEVIRDPAHAHDYRLSEWDSALGDLGLHYRLHARWDLPLDFTTWVQRIGAPPANVARLETLFDSATPEAVAAFRITPPPQRAFCLHAALLSGEKRASLACS